MKNLIAIVGNTGVGKSQLAVEIAKAFNGEIINGDSMQMYRGIDVVTNKHPVAERQGIPHHLLGHVDWDKQYTVQQFESEATECIESIHQRKKLPILVGGTHYYIQSLITENSLISHSYPKAEQLSPQKLNILNDPEQVERELRLIDPLVTQKFHPNDTRRLRRALEIFYATGKRPSDIYDDQATNLLTLRYRVLVFWIYCQRETLVQRLDSRVESMLASGLIEEAEALYKVYETIPRNTQGGPWQVIGFKQLIPFLEGEPLKPSVEAMKAETRQYAKKQTKWIVNKLKPMLEKLGGQMATLDSSNLPDWHTTVGERALAITKDWLAEVPISLPLTPEHITLQRKNKDFTADQWVRYTCEVCLTSKGEPVVVMGEDAWQTHINCRSHRRQTARTDQEAN